MTRMASFEENEGKKSIAVAKYFRSDFILKNVLKAVVCATLSFLVGVALYFLYGFEEFMEEIYNIDLFVFAQNILFYYLVLVGVYSVIIFLASTYQYIMAKKNLKCYYQNLKKLNALYEEK